MTRSRNNRRKPTPVAATAPVATAPVATAPAATAPVETIAVRKSCNPSGVGLSHYVLMDRKKAK